MANILIQIQASVQDFSRKLKSLKTDINNFVSVQKTLAKGQSAVSDANKTTINSFNALDKTYKNLASVAGKFDQQQRMSANTFLRTSSNIKGVITRYDNLQKTIAAGGKVNAAYAKGLTTQFNNIAPSVVQAVRYINNLDTSYRKSLLTFQGASKQVRNTILDYTRLSDVTKRAAAGPNALGRSWSSFTKLFRSASNEGKKGVGIFRDVGKSLLNFNLISRSVTGSARAIGTSMIFAGGAFRDLGVGINVVSSLLQTFIPAIGNIVAALGRLGPIGVAIGAALTSLVGNLIAMGTTAAVAGIAIGKLIKDGVSFNAAMEENTVTVATLILQYKDLVDAQGNVIGEQSKYTEAQFRNLSIEKQQEEITRRRLSTTTMFRTAIRLAEKSVVQLTVAAADSIYTTKDLLSAFQATYSVLGKYGVASDQAARLTGQFARVASVAGVSAANLASQMTLWLTGAGRITSPLARFATGIGLGKDRMKELNDELKRFRDNPFETNRIINEVTNLLTVFNVGGRIMSDTWTGIMSNMQESFELFAGLVTKGFFETVRNAVFNFNELAEGADRATGALSRIFKIDPETGTFFNNVTKISEIFQQPFQEAAVTLQSLISTIGKDIASAIDYLTTSLINLAVWVGKNETEILTTYETVKQLVSTVGELLFSLMNIFGVTRDIDGNMKNIQNSVSFINDIVAFIVAIIDSLVAGVRILAIAFGYVVTAVTATVEAMYNIAAIGRNIVIWAENLSNSIKGISEQVEYIGVNWNWVNWALGKTYAQQEKLKQKTDDVLERGSLLLDIEEKRLKVIRDQTRAYQTQASVWQQITNEINTPGSRLNNSLVRPKGIETEQQRMARELQNQKIIQSEFDARMGVQEDAYFQGVLEEEVKKLKVTLSGLAEDEIVSIAQANARKKIREATALSATERAKRQQEDAQEGKEQVRVRRQVLDTLFNVRKEHAEAELNIVKESADNALQTVRDNIEIERNLLKSKLDEQEISIDEYYKNLQSLRQADLNSEIQARQNELALLVERNRIAKTSLDQDDLRSRAEYEASEKSAYDAARLENELSETKIKRQTLELNFLNDQKQLVIEIGRLQKKSLQETINLLEDQRKALRDFFNNVRGIRLTLDDLIGDPTDAAALQRAIDEMSRSYTEMYKNIKHNPGLFGSPQEHQEALNNLVQIAAIETTLLENSRLRAQFEREEYQRSRELNALDSDRANGLITEVRYRERILELNRQNADALEKYSEILLERIEKAGKAGADSEVQRLLEEYDTIQDKIRELRTVTEDVLLDMNRGFRSAFKDFFSEMQSDITNIGDAFLNLGKKLQSAFQEALSERLVSQFLGPLLGEEGQTSGRAGGWLASVGRMMGLDRNSKAAEENNRQAISEAGSTSASASTEQKFGEYIDTSNDVLDAAKTALEAMTARITAETENVNQLIKDAVISIQGQTTLNVDGTKADFTGKGVLGTEAFRIFTTSEGGGLVGSVNRLADLISRGEGDYNSVNLGQKHGYRSGTRNLTSMTIQEVITRQAKREFNAAGRYQIIRDTLPQAVKALGLDKNLKFDKEIQDKIFREYLISTKRPEVSAYITGKSNNLGAAQYALAAEFASVGVPFDTVYNKRNIKKGQSLYAGVGNNKASISPEEIAAALNAERQSYLLSKSNEAVKAEITKIDPSASKDLAENAPQVDAITTGFETQKASLDNVNTGVTRVGDQLGVGLNNELGTFASRLEAFLTTNVVTPITTAINGVFSLSAPNISSPEFAFGGYISGPGGPTDDKIPAWLSNGEYVIKAKAVKALGLDRLHQLNNADKIMPKFGFGGFLGSINGSIGKFLTRDVGKLMLGTAIPMAAQTLLGKDGASAMALAMPLILGGVVKPNKAEKAAEESQKLIKQYGNPFSAVPLIRRAKGGIVGNIPKFAGGGGMTLPSPILTAPTGGSGGFWSSANGQALQGGLISSAISIGFALLGRLFAKKQPKSDPNRVKDPYGLNPETLTFYKKPIITGARNYLASGGHVTSNMLLNNMPGRGSGFNSYNIDDILKDVGLGSESPTINQTINITTPDVHSFRNSKGQVERDLARMTQRGVKRRAPKY